MVALKLETSNDILLSILYGVHDRKKLVHRLLLELGILVGRIEATTEPSHPRDPGSLHTERMHS